MRPEPTFSKYILLPLIALLGSAATFTYSRYKRAEKAAICKYATLDDCVNAIIKIESNNNPNAVRKEPKLKDASYGLMQILTKTAKDLETKHPELPRLGSTNKELAKSLRDPEINRLYGTALFKEELDFYKTPELAVAAYNSGHFTPRNARVQQQLNELLGTDLALDGIIGPETKAVITAFQKQYNLKNPDYKIDVDGLLGQETYLRIQYVWKTRYPDKPNPKGIIPENNITPRHVEKFLSALRKVK